MKTPITDAALDKWACGGTSSETIVPAMRSLELDRAALMEALEEVSKDFTTFRQIAAENGVFGTWGVLSLRQSEFALTTARANFPTE